ncbi:rRNA processing/ribosome biogenesis-domain-containing protein [Plectosphaerella plurivora]|uniref:Pre-rRNA-processing protein RIX1 n=1 Tax=Plectosphaerella plurivora TaxID=936078 RepID=A0A9P9AAK4_9PEZI|nr:rRNA processing/ribosome biogenesis-domain-containing protein [Plectosphaerella plurivora]
MSLPPDLRVLCRRLTSTPPSQLPHATPAFVRNVLQCRDVLSAPQDIKAKGNAAEAAMLVHKLKSIVGNLIKGKTSPGRFTGVVLAKAMVDVGGWECLREAGPWVAGLLSILKKNDPPAVKELAIVSLVRIYTLVHEFQTLTREIATPTLRDFFDACLALIRAPAPGQRTRASPALIETVLDAFATLMPLYPATCRPFNARVRTAARLYVAPTCSDDAPVPRTLQRAARRAIVSLHFTTAGKTGPSEDWVRTATDIIRDFHDTADHVFRAVQESWQPIVPRTRAAVAFDGPAEQPDAADGLPGWTGVRAGSDRLVGHLRLAADLLRQPTKTPVAVPVGALMEAVQRVAQISKTSRTQTWEQALETHPAIGREEKEELWTCIPAVHLAALELLGVLFRRLRYNAMSLVPEALDSVLLVLKSGIDSPAVRAASYATVNVLLQVSGPGLSKTAVDAIGVVMLACCRDLQQDAGYLAARAAPPPAAAGAEAKKNGMTANADLFLPTAKTDGGPTAGPVHGKLSQAHRAAAESLLAALLTHLPQRQVKPGIRGLLDQTAILCQSRDGMLASVLNPYINEAGRSYPSILPHLSRRFPHDQGVEVLRSNIRTSVQASAEDMRLAAGFEELEAEEGEDEEMEEEEAATEAKGDEEMADDAPRAASAFVPAAVDVPSQTLPDGPFVERSASTVEVPASSTFSAAQKRKHEGPVETTPPLKKQETDPGADDSDDDESVHLNMDIDDLDDEEDDE